MSVPLQPVEDLSAWRASERDKASFTVDLDYARFDDDARM